MASIFTCNEVRETQIWEDKDWRYILKIESINSNGEFFGYDWSLRHPTGQREIASGTGARTPYAASVAATTALLEHRRTASDEGK